MYRKYVPPPPRQVVVDCYQGVGFGTPIMESLNGMIYTTPAE